MFIRKEELQTAWASSVSVGDLVRKKCLQCSEGGKAVANTNTHAGIRSLWVKGDSSVLSSHRVWFILCRCSQSCPVLRARDVSHAFNSPLICPGTTEERPGSVCVSPSVDAGSLITPCDSSGCVFPWSSAACVHVSGSSNISAHRCRWHGLQLQGQAHHKY